MSDNTPAAPAATSETIPLWVAIGIVVFVSVPFSLWLGKYSLAVWASFIVWAEYFALGARPAALRTIAPAFIYAALLTGVCLAIVPLMDWVPDIRTDGDLGLALTLGVGVALMVYSMKFSKTLQDGSLPFFNGISLVLAVYFTQSFPPGVDGQSLTPLWAAVWTVVLAVFGMVLGVVNVWMTFPRSVDHQG